MPVIMTKSNYAKNRYGEPWQKSATIVSYNYVNQ